jgi:hypothetical protein
MTVEKALTRVSFPASADLSTKQFYLVNLASDGEVQLATSGAQVVGVLQDKPTAVGRAAVVAIQGISKVYAQGAITLGNALIASTVGTAIAASTGGTAFIFGRALESLSTAESPAYISVSLTFEGPTSTA